MGIDKDLIAAASTPIALAILARGDSDGDAIRQPVRELSGGRMAGTDRVQQTAAAPEPADRQTAPQGGRQRAPGVEVRQSLGPERPGRYPLPPLPPADPDAADGRQSMEERALLERVRAGDELAFARLFERHWTGVYRVLSRLVGDPAAARDVAQEVFVQLFRNPPALGEAPLRAWLCRVAIHRGNNALRSDRRRGTGEDVLARDPSRPEAAGAGFLEEANRVEERHAVRRTLMSLTGRHRECLVLRSEGLSYAEIAAALGVAPGSVGTLLGRAERAFKDAYLAQRGGM